MELVEPSVELYGSFRRCFAEMEELKERLPAGCGLASPEEADSPDVVRTLVDAAHTVQHDGWVTASNYWIISGGEVAGFINLRHALTPALLDLYGHIGYSVRPSYRRRGIAARALGEVVRRAGERGMDRVLVCCENNNEASRRVIVANGGELEDIRRDPAGPLVERYWISIS